jgi:hypothetical protein
MVKAFLSYHILTGAETMFGKLLECQCKQVGVIPFTKERTVQIFNMETHTHLHCESVVLRTGM